MSQLRNWDKDKKTYRVGRQRLDERSLREAVNIEGGVRSKVYQTLTQVLIKAPQHEGRVPIAWVMVFAEPAQPVQRARLTSQAVFSRTIPKFLAGRVP